MESTRRPAEVWTARTESGSGGSWENVRRIGRDRLLIRSLRSLVESEGERAGSRSYYMSASGLDHREKKEAHNFRQHLASVLHPEMLLDLIRQSTPNFLTSIKIIKSESNSMST